MKLNLWIFRQTERDIIKLYNSLTPYIRTAVNDSNDYMLNFGYWNEGINSPREAQRRLCSMIAETSNLNSASTVLDIGSGFSVPAIYWKSIFNNESS